MKEFGSASDKTAKIGGTVRAIAALGRLVLESCRKFFLIFGGMSLLLVDATCSTAKGLFVPGQRIGRDSLISQMVAELETSFEKYREAEKKFWDELK